MSCFFKGTNILNHAKDFFYDEYSIENQIEKFKDMTLIQLSALKRENEQLAVEMELSNNTYHTQHQDTVFTDFDKMIIELYPLDTQDAYFNPKKYDENKKILYENRKLLNEYFRAQNRYKSDPEYRDYAKYNDALSLAIKNLSDESKEKTKFNKKIYDRTEVLCECGAHSYRNVLARHRKSALHARKMEKILNPLLNPLLKKVEQNTETN
jgi:hypothetical protein